MIIDVIKLESVEEDGASLELGSHVNLATELLDDHLADH